MLNMPSDSVMLSPTPRINEPFKIAVLGRTSVGKTALVVRFICKRFIWNYDPTLESTYKHHVTFDDEQHNIEVLDTAGCWDTEERSRLEANIRWGEAFIIVYDVTDRTSFDAAKSICERVYELRQRNGIGCSLVGNKTDLEHLRTVPRADGERAALDLACSFHEVSACIGGSTIDEIFVDACRDASLRRCAVAARGQQRSCSRMSIGGGEAIDTGALIIVPKARRRNSAQLFFSKFLPGAKKQLQ